jgi:hypothetical protein
MCSLKRQLEKFHLTVGVDMDPEQKLFEKSISFALTDSSTPVIGPLTAKVIKLAGTRKSTGKLARDGDEWSVDVQYPNSYAKWMDDVATEELSTFNFTAFDDWLAKTTKLDELLHVPCFYELGREYAFTDWSCEPGLIHRTMQVLGVKQKKKPAFDIAKVKFGE